MKQVSKLGLAVLLLVFAIACKQATTSDEASAETAADSVSVETTSSNTAVVKKESNRKFVRTADLKFKVKKQPSKQE